MATKRKAMQEQTSSRSAALPSAIQDATLLDIEALRQIIEILEASDVSQLSWRRGEERLTIRRGHPPATIVHAAANPGMAHLTTEAPSRRTSSEAEGGPPGLSPSAQEKPGVLVTSPFVGTFYRTPAPDQPPFVEVGASVRKGQVLCIVEAMKLMNEIEAEAAGKIAEIFVENGQPVEFGQSLFRIEAA
jgi:acetyl-CoA carboxylase biotin carboxyl carrier protein